MKPSKFKWAHLFVDASKCDNSSSSSTWESQQPNEPTALCVANLTHLSTKPAATTTSSATTAKNIAAKQSKTNVLCNLFWGIWISGRWWWWIDVLSIISTQSSDSKKFELRWRRSSCSELKQRAYSQPCYDLFRPCCMYIN